jgi:hypothetical protein
MLPGVRKDMNLAYDSRLSITLIGLCEPSTRSRDRRCSSAGVSAAPCSLRCSEGRKASAASTLTQYTSEPRREEYSGAVHSRSVSGFTPSAARKWTRPLSNGWWPETAAARTCAPLALYQRSLLCATLYTKVSALPASAFHARGRGERCRSALTATASFVSAAALPRPPQRLAVRSSKEATPIA